MANKRTGMSSGTNKQGLWYFGSGKSSAIGKPSTGPTKIPVVTKPRSKEIVIGTKGKAGILD